MLCSVVTERCPSLPARSIVTPFEPAYTFRLMGEMRGVGDMREMGEMGAGKEKRRKEEGERVSRGTTLIRITEHY